MPPLPDAGEMSEPEQLIPQPPSSMGRREMFLKASAEEENADENAPTAESERWPAPGTTSRVALLLGGTGVLAAALLACALFQTVAPWRQSRRMLSAGGGHGNVDEDSNSSNAEALKAIAALLTPQPTPRPRDACGMLLDRAQELEGNDTLVAGIAGQDGETTSLWIRGLQGETCEKACARVNLQCEFRDENWPRSRDNVTDIAHKLGLCCTNFSVAETTYDPSVSGTICSHGPFKPKSMWDDWRTESIRSCKSVPPLATIRLCQCVDHHKKLDCESCSPTCWQRQNCCFANQDPCATDPVAVRTKSPVDPDFWGSGPANPDQGVDPDAWCQLGHPEEFRLPEIHSYTGEGQELPVRVKVLTYNLYWWSLFKQRQGNGGSAGKLIAKHHSVSEPFDLMAFQECEGPGWVLGDAGLAHEFSFFQGPHTTCMAYRKADWALLDNGHELVAEDGHWVRGNYYGKRILVWLRLLHMRSGRTVFFANHHGPLPVNSGGLCGGVATAYNVLDVIQARSNATDAVILVGDFNAGPNSTTVQAIATELNQVYNGVKFGGVDNFLTNVGKEHILARQNYGGGGSDHDALGLVLNLTSSQEASLVVRV